MRSRTYRCGLIAAVMGAAPAIAHAQAVSGWTEEQQAKRTILFASLDPQQIASQVTIKDDELESVARLTTETAFKFKGSFTDLTRADNFFRAILNKTTGRTTYQLYQHLTYTDERRFSFANYETPDGPVSATLTINSGEVNCPYGTCVWWRDLAFEVPEEVLRAVAARAAARPVKPWRFRFKAQQGDDWTDDIAPAEAAGLLLAVDAFRQKHRLP